MKKRKRAVKLAQIEFQTVLNDCFRTHERKLIRYMAQNVELYKGFAEFIAPSLTDSRQIFSRIAFSILSANAPFADSVKALAYVMENIGNVDAGILKHGLSGMTPAKADYLNELAGVDALRLLRGGVGEKESWSDYRERLMNVRGLHRAKASFAVALLYPLTADVACVDTWIQKVFLGHTGFKTLSRVKYEFVEAKIRRYARRFGVSTFLAQWMIWDHARGGTPNAHAIFPGAHKTI